MLAALQAVRQIFFNMGVAEQLCLIFSGVPRRLRRSNSLSPLRIRKPAEFHQVSCFKEYGHIYYISRRIFQVEKIEKFIIFANYISIDYNLIITKI